jgi:HTH-type transcriptional regulator/antitoxin HigA
MNTDYLALMREFPLTAIRDETHYTQAMVVIDRLTDQPHLSQGEEDYLDALSDLVWVYEEENYPIPEASGVAVLRHLMEANDLTQRDMEPIFGSHSVVSEILSGKRQLNVRQIAKLSERFHLPADVFIDRITAS